MLLLGHLSRLVEAMCARVCLRYVHAIPKAKHRMFSLALVAFHFHRYVRSQCRLGLTAPHSKSFTEVDPRFHLSQA
jgi:hypothetical protein